MRSKNRSVQGILNNAFGKEYYYKEANRNLKQAVDLLQDYGAANE